MTAKKNIIKTPRFTAATYAEAVEASRVAVAALDFNELEFETVACGYDGAELRIPRTPLAVSANFLGKSILANCSDYEFLCRNAITSKLSHCATGQLKYVLRQPDWLTFAMGSTPRIFETYTPQGEPAHTDELEMKRTKMIRGGLDWLLAWLSVPDQCSGAFRNHDFIDESAVGHALLGIANDIYLHTPDPRGAPKEFRVSQDELSKMTSQAIGMLVAAGGHLDKLKGRRGALHTFYEDVFMKLKDSAHKKAQKTRARMSLYEHPVENWFWEFTKLVHHQGWHHRTSTGLSWGGDLLDEGIEALGAFRIGIDELQTAMSGDEGPVMFGGALNFLYDEAERISEHGIGITELGDLSSSFKKVAVIPEESEPRVARATRKVIRALMRLHPQGALLAGGEAQRLECARMIPKGYPHILSERQAKRGNVEIHESFDGLMAFGLKSVKADRITVDPAVICDTQGALLPYAEAVAALELRYNEFSEDTTELNEACAAIHAVHPEAGLSFAGVIQERFGAQGEQSFNDMKRLELEDSSFTRIDTAGKEIGEEPLSLEFSIGAQSYTGVFLGSWEDEELATVQSAEFLKGVAAWAIYNSYSDHGKQSWLMYRGLLTRDDEIRVKECDPKKGLTPVMYQDFVDFCWEAVASDGWSHELCRYDGIGQIDITPVVVGGDVSTYHAWGIWRA